MFFIMYFAVIVVLSIFKFVFKFDGDLINIIGFAMVIATQSQLAINNK